MLLRMELFYIGIHVLAYSFYTILLKSSQERIIVFFWANVWAYLGYLALFFSKQLSMHHPIRCIEDMLFDFTLNNAPFYFLMAIFWVGSIVVLNALYEKFDVSLVVPVVRMSLLFTTIGYIILGASFSWKSLLSVCLVFIGSIVSSFEKISLKKPLAPLKKIPLLLLTGGLIQALLTAGTNFITYICTHSTDTTQKIIAVVTNTFYHIYRLPFSFLEPFYYNVGVRFFIVVVFFMYMLFFKKMFKEVFYALFKHFKYITLTGTVFLCAVVTYQSALFTVHDANIVLALSELAVPLILFIGHLLLKEKVTQPKLVGCVIIVLGGFVSLFA